MKHLAADSSPIRKSDVGLSLYKGMWACTTLRVLAALTTLWIAGLAVAPAPAEAAEDGKGIYLLGSSTTMSGFVPPPGTYGASYKYFYTGDASANAGVGIGLDQLGDISLQADIDVEADILVDLLTGLVVTPHKVFGGQLGLGVLLPVGWQDISVDADVLATLTLPDGRTFTAGQTFGIDDDTVEFGDPLLTAFLGWHSGNWHWKVSGLLNIPIGAYDSNDLANMGFNRWAFDSSTALTWLNLETGREASVNAGFTFNGENDDTSYETGTEFHVEWALMQNFSKAFGVGLTGYHYQQVTGDSGTGARLGSFKGRVTAVGPNINYNFQWGQLPVSTTMRWLHEFNAKNRLDGDAFYITATIPLGGPRR